jgi:putative flippase GtrA
MNKRLLKFLKMFALTVVLSIAITYAMLVLHLPSLIHKMQGTDILEGEDLAQETFIISSRIIFPVAVLMAFLISRKLLKINQGKE